MLSIKNLKVNVEDKVILDGVNLDIKPGEVHAIMGPNGSGKSTLSHVLVGKEGYDIKSGEVLFENKDLLSLAPDERSHQGVFLAFQYPIEIPGVSNVNLLKAAVNAKRKANGESALDAMDFVKFLKEKVRSVNMDEDFLHRPVNEGFSGGEKKRNEMLQMAVLEPKLAILDETDSGLDIDALKAVADGINAMRDGKRSILLITHYQRLLDYVAPDFVHVLANGKIVRSGDKSLALELEEKGYEWLGQND